MMPTRRVDNNKHLANSKKRTRQKIRVVKTPVKQFSITPDPKVPKQFDVWMGAVKFKFQIEDLIELTKTCAEVLNRSKSFWK